MIASRPEKVAPFLCGCGVTAGLFLLAGSARPAANDSTPGRFQVAAGPSHAFVVDTATGEVWGRFGSNRGTNSPDFYDVKRDAR